MVETSTERNQNENSKPQFLLTGFTQTAGIRIYGFEGIVDARRISYTVAVDLALIPCYGIRIQDLPLLCRRLLQQQAERGEIGAFVLTEQNMRSHAEELAIMRGDVEHRKKQRRHAAVESIL
jgi:hypothetical protein